MTDKTIITITQNNNEAQHRDFMKRINFEDTYKAVKELYEQEVANLFTIGVEDVNVEFETMKRVESK